MSGYFFKAGEFAALCGVKKDTLLHYDHIGILRPERVDDENGYRYYSVKQFYTFDLISALKKLGMPLKEIRAYLENRNPDDFLALLREQLEVLGEELLQLERIERLLRGKILATEQVKQVHFDEVHLEWFPEEYHITVKAPGYDHYDEAQFLLSIRPLLQRARKYDSLAFPPGDIILKESLEKGRFIEDLYFSRVVLESDAENIRVKPAGTYAVLYHQGSYESQYTAYRYLCTWIQEQGYRIVGDLYAEDLLHYLSSADPQGYVARISVQIDAEKEG